MQHNKEFFTHAPYLYRVILASSQSYVYGGEKLKYITFNLNRIGNLKIASACWKQ